MKRPVVAALGLCALVSLAYAADLKPFQEEAKTKFDKQARSLIDEVNAACGTKYAAITSDFENFDPKNFVTQQPGTVCSETTYNMKEICKSEPYKKAVAAKIKGISCLTKPATPALEVKGGVVTHHMGTGKSVAGSDGQKVIKAFLDQ